MDVETQSELEQPRWAVISFGGVIAGGLTYKQAQATQDQGDPGQFITTQDAADRAELLRNQREHATENSSCL